MQRRLLPFFFILFLILSLNTYPQTQGGRTYTNIMFTATLNGTQETPSVATAAEGSAWAILSDDRKTLFYQVTYAQLTSAFTASHFHLGIPGIAGGVIQSISFNGNTASGSWTNLPDSIVGQLISGQIYINIHSVNNPGGEIRGQLSPVKGLGFTISLDANQTGDSTDNSTATGTGWAVLVNNGTALNYNITFAGLSSTYTEAHFHDAREGVNGGVEQPITFSDSSVGGTVSTIMNADLDSLIHNDWYVNIHSVNFPNGEIRGQLIRVGLIGFNASLDGSQETPPVITAGSGTAFAVLDNDLKSLTYQISYAQLSSGFTASHFHQGAFGISGGVIEPITAFKGNTAQGIWSGFSDNLVINLIKGNIYLNVHTALNPGGEIRGQLWMNNGIGFSANLNTAQDLFHVQSGATGTAWMLYADDTLKFQITFGGLSSGFYEAHIHQGVPGVNGKVVHNLFFKDSTLNSFASDLDDTTKSDLINGSLYVNIHTYNYPGGELRGQITQMMPQSNITTAVQDKPKSIPGQFSLLQNYPNPFNPSTIISWQLAAGSNVKLKIYDILGNEVTALVNEFENAGEHSISFNTQQVHKQLASGIYFYRLQAGGFVASRKMMVLK
jgi:hypothetical protein